MRVRQGVRAVLLAALLAGCAGDRERPGPVAPPGASILTAQLLAPPPGSTVVTATDVAVRVEARDLSARSLQGVGFVARRVTGGAATVDSALVLFSARSDTTHQFTLRVPDSYPTNTQVDIYGIAVGVGGVTRLSDPVHVVIVRCPEGICG